MRINFGNIIDVNNDYKNYYRDILSIFAVEKYIQYNSSFYYTFK